MEAFAPTTAPLLRIEYTPTRSEFVEGSLFPFRAQRRRNMLFTLFSSAMLVVFGLLLRSEHDTWMFYVAGVLALIALLQPFTSRRFLAEYFRKHPQFSEETVATYSDEGVFVQTGSVDSLTRWPAFTHFSESRNLIFLHRGPQNHVFIAKRVFATPADLDAYRQLLLHYIGRTSMESRRGFPVQTPSASNVHEPDATLKI